MRNQLRLLFGLSLALATMVHASAATKTFNKTDDKWDLAANWDPPGKPTDTDLAVIPNGSTCRVQVTNNLQICKQLQVDAGGFVIIESDQLIVGDGSGSSTSTVNGEIDFDNTASATPELQIRAGTSGTLTLAGSGLITARGADSWDAGLIKPFANAPTLAASSSALRFAGSLTFRVHLAGSATYNLDGSDTMVFGYSLVQYKMSGNSALNVSGGTAEFLNAELSASGSECAWSVALSAGEVDIDSGCSAAGSHMAYTVSSSGLLEANAAHGATSFTVTGGTAQFIDEFTAGNVTLSGGTVEIEATSTSATSSDFVVSGGTLNIDAALTADDFTISGGTVNAGAALIGDDFHISGGNIYVNENVTGSHIHYSGGTFHVASNKSAAFSL